MAAKPTSYPVNLTLTTMTTDTGDLVDDLSNQSSTPWPQHVVEAGMATEVTAVLVLLVGVMGNLVVMGVFLGRPWGRIPLQVDRVIGLLALTGLITTLVSTPFHLCSFVTGVYPARGSLCQLQGFLLNLLCLLSLWYTMLLAVERYVKFASPHEHTLTFSLLNLNVVLSGVLVLLLIEVSGPIYGWAEYAFVQDCGVCVLDPVSTHILTYTVIQTSCYISLPALITVCATVCVLHRCYTHPAPLTHGSQVLRSGGGVSVLCGAMLLSVLLLLPYHVLLMLQAAQVHVPASAKVLSYWMKITSLCCVYPVILLSARPKEVWPAVAATVQKLGGCGVVGCVHQSDGTPHLTSLEVSARSSSDTQALSKTRRFSHSADTTFLSLSPQHSTLPPTPASTPAPTPALASV